MQMTLLRSVVSQSHRIEGGATDEAVQALCFLWERGALQHTDGKGKKRKSTIGLLEGVQSPSVIVFLLLKFSPRECQQNGCHLSQEICPWFCIVLNLLIPVLT